MTRYPPFARPCSIHDLVKAAIVDGRFDEQACRRMIEQLGPCAPAIAATWEMLARDEQLPPQGDWTTWLNLAGRGAGKTRAGAEWVLRKVREGHKMLHLIAPTEADYRDVMIRGQSGLLSIAAPHERPTYHPSARRLEFPNGAQALCFSAEQPERLRGPQCSAAWCDEVAAWRHADATWDMMSFGLRLGRHPQVMASTTPKPIALIKRLLADPNTAVTRGSTYDNRANLPASYFEKIIIRYEGTRLGRQELLAEVLTDNPDALWNYGMFERPGFRLTLDRLPPMERVVVAVDPPATSGENADECGIIVAGIDANKRGYILADCSSQGDSPAEWAARALKAYRIYNASCLVVEVNQGGDMVREVLENVNRHSKFPVDGLRIREVRAFQGKTLRAEPVAALYEQGRIHHVGTFGALEDQQCDYTIDFERRRPSRHVRESSIGSGRSYSPDRLDALVYAITELLLHAPIPVSIGRRSG